jgi:hypothetical protein
MCLSDDCKLIINIVDKYLRDGNIEDAYMYCEGVQSNGYYMRNVEWMNVLVDVNEKYLNYLMKQPSVDESKIVSVIVSLLLNIISVFELEAAAVGGVNHIRSLISLVIKYDAYLYRLSVSPIASQPTQPAHIIISELKVLLYFIISQLLLSLVPNKHVNWKLGVACLLCTFLTPPLDMDSVPIFHKSELQPWVNRSQARYAICLRQYQLIVKNCTKDVFDFISSIKMIELARGQFIHHMLANSKDTPYNVRESFIASDGQRLANVKRISVNDFSPFRDSFDKSFILQCGDVLSSIVWLSLVMKSENEDIPFSKWSNLLFPNVQETTPILSRTEYNTFCLYDVEAFFVLCMEYWIESHDCHMTLSDSLAHNGFSWPLISVPQHLVSIYKDVRKYFSPNSKTISVPEGITLRRSVTLFITEVRAQPPVKLTLHQVLTLARHFKIRVSHMLTIM